MAQTYDGRAITNMPIVSDEGLVYSGNGRTMAGQLAAANGTDGAYTEALLENAKQYGFTAEQVESVPNARVVFMTDERLPYNTTTLALFNQTEQQTQSNTASAAANVRKLTPEAVGHIIAAVQEFDTVDAFFGDSRAPFELVNRLIADGIISERDKAAFVDNGRLTNTGKDRLTALLFGTAFDEKTIRLLGDNAKVRNSVMRALPQILENKGLGDFSLFEHINNAIAAIYDMDTNGMSFFEFTRQIDIEGKTASDKYTAFELLLVDEMVNGGVQAFRDVLSGYNARAKGSAGGQLDMFTGDVLTKEELTKQILQEYEQRKANERGGAQPESAVAGTSESDGEKIEPTLLNVVRTLYSKGKEVASKLFQRSYFDLAQTPTFMQDLGLRGDKFTIRYGVISRHVGKDAAHNLSESDWVALPEALQNPFAITKISNKENAFRIYTTLQTESGEYVVVGADVKNAGREIEVNAISTVFGRRNDANLPENEEVIYRSETITPEQSSLLERPNFAQYPTEQEFSADKGTKNIPNTQEKTQKSVEEQQNSGKSLVQGTEMTYDEVVNVVSDGVASILEEQGLSEDVEVVSIEVIGSRVRREAKDDSDLDILLYYTGDMKEDSMFNALNPNDITINGIKVDINPIRDQDSGDPEKWHKRDDAWREQDRETTERTPREEPKNTIFTDDAYAAARQRIQSKLNRLNAGIDPEMLSDGIIVAGYHVERGIRKFADFAKEMIKDFGDVIRPYLKSFYNGLRDLPESQAFVNEMDDYATVAGMDVNSITIEEQVQPSTEQVQLSTEQVQLSTEQVQPKQVSVEGLFNDLKTKGETKLSDNVIEEQPKEEPAHIKNYREIKEQYPDAMVLFRAGDFYEVYLEDAQDASKILGITLTKTGNYPLAGFPFHALDSYLPKLVRAGKRVAIAEKVKDKPEVVETVENQPNLAQNLQESEKNSNFAGENVDTQPVEQPAIITDAVGEITKSTDTRDGSDIWLVNPTDRLSKEEFAELKKRAKAHNGYYSNFKQNRGFLFRTEEDAIAFNRINENELTTDQVLADTGLVIGEAETRRNEAETIAENTRVEPNAPTVGEAREQVAKAEQQINAAMAQVDEATEQVNDQLMLLGYYESESDANEWGLSKKAEKAALKDVNKVANQLAKDLGVEGKIKASANIAPAGGEITFRIPLLEGRELHVYIPIHLNAGYYRLTGNYSDLYIPDLWGGWSQGSILYRVDAEDRYGTNYYARGTTTYNDFLNAVRYIAKDYLPQVKAATAEESSVTPELQTPLEKAKARNAKKQTTVAPTIGMGDLFADTIDAVQAIVEEQEQPTNNTQVYDETSRRAGSSEPTTGNIRSSDGQQSAGVRSEVTIQEDTRPTDGGGVTEVLRDEGEESRSGLPLHAIEQEPIPDNHKKNKRNNNVKRGVDYAPKTAKERFEANIAAIQLLKELEESGKQATPAQMKVLRKFTGWGGLGEFFKETYWASSDTDKLKKLLTPEEYDAANLSRNSAYFTPGAVIDRLWDIAAKFGFQGGNITEGSAGTGEILARIPQAMNERSDILAVEIDPITGGILKQLYPDARVEIDGFQNVSIPNGSQDLVITNVPFVRDLRVFDKEESDLSKRFTQIQDFCIAKNIRKLREGGLGIFIAGKSSLDSSKDLRKWIVKEGNCDVVGAFRLNKDTFNGTSATADIIVVKKRVNGVVSPNAIDILDVETIKVDEVEVDTTFNSKTRTWEPVTKRVALAYNQHYVQHPEDMGGEMALGKDEGDTRFGGGSSACYPRRNINQMQRLDDWIANMGKGESMMPAPVVPAELKDYEFAKASQQGQIVLNSKGEICIADRGMAVPMQLNSNKVKGQSKEQVVKDYIALKEAVNKTLYVQLTSDNETDLQAARKTLNDQYDSFVKKYGYLNKNTALSFLRNDVEYPSIAAIEKYEEIETPTGKEVKVEKTDIFKKRVIGVKSEPTPTNTRDAVVLSVQQFGRLDLAQMAQWLNMSQEAVREDIVKERLGFVNPETQQLQIRHEYLSGNVRQKLAYAQAHNENGEYATNIEELQKVIPMDIPAHLIEFSLGSTWIDPKMYEDFVREKYGVTIKYSHIGGVWSESSRPYYLATEKNRAAGVHSDLLNMHVFGNELFISAMNNVPYIVSKQETYYEGGQKKTRTVTDKDASQACATRIDEIRDEFTEWARQHMQQDAELAQRMERVYNDKFNAIVVYCIQKYL